MKIESAKFISPSKFESESSSILATINGTVMYVPIHTDNTEYQAIQKWVAEGNSIEEAD